MNDQAIEKLELIKLLLKTEHPGVQKQILSIITEYLNIENRAYYNLLQETMHMVKLQDSAYFNKVAIHNPEAVQSMNNSVPIMTEPYKDQYINSPSK